MVVRLLTYALAPKSDKAALVSTPQKE